MSALLISTLILVILIIIAGPALYLYTLPGLRAGFATGSQARTPDG